VAERAIDGPDAIFSDELEPSRGQYQAIAVAALELLGVEEPKTRLDATLALGRLRLALREHTPFDRKLPEVPDL
jgi:hypothetical protein